MLKFKEQRLGFKVDLFNYLIDKIKDTLIHRPLQVTEIEVHKRHFHQTG